MFGFKVIDTWSGREANISELTEENWVSDRLYIYEIDGWWVSEDGNLILMDDCGKFAYAHMERFKIEVCEP